MKFDLKNVFLEGLSKRKLSPFYILKPAPQTPAPRQFLEDWLNDFFVKAMVQENGLTEKQCKDIVKNGHADLLWPKREDETKNYNIKDGDLDELFSFMQYGALELPWRFAVIEDPNKLSRQYLNKLLKTLEEPSPNTSIFFLDHKSSQFLDTIHSRATQFTIRDDKNSLKWTLPPEKMDVKEWLEKRADLYPNTLGNKEIFALLLNYFEKSEGIGALIEKLKSTNDSDSELAGLVVEYEADRPGRFKQKENLCKELEWFNKSKVFNNSRWERILGLLCALDS